jgi:hypothetical protein
MRIFEDDAGRAWDVVVGRESYGAPVLIFSLRDGNEVRKRMLASERMLDANQELSDLTEDELREQLRASEEWA